LTRLDGDLTEALRTYERLRMPRTRAAQLGSRRRATENHLASPLARLRRDAALAWRRRFGTDKTPFQVAWLYEYDVAAEGGRIAGRAS
jgi:salicylate hydroxylase